MICTCPHRFGHFTNCQAMTYLRIRPTAPAVFVPGDEPKTWTLSLTPEDDEPPTERRPELAAAWAAVMTDYRETTQ